LGHIVDRDRFARALHQGLGRPILYARSHDVSAFRDAIMHACVHSCALDPQSEGTRAAYMLEVLHTLPDRQLYCEAVVKALPGCGDDWDAVQRFHFAARLAAEGDDQAKRAMYESFHPGPRMGESIAVDFLAMDGLDGMLFAAEKIGALLEIEPDALDLGYLLSQSIDTCGEQETLRALREAGQRNPRIEAYRLAAEAERRREIGRLGSREIDRIKRLGYEQLKTELPAMKRYRLPMWGEHASDDDLYRAAEGLTSAQSTANQLAHLRIFESRRFPLDPSVLLGLAGSEQAQVALAATKALGRITHPSVRELAFRLVSDRSAGRRNAIELLVSNSQPADHDAALGWFESEDDPDVRHSMGMDLVDFWDRHPDEDSIVRMLLALYEDGPCSFCREGVVRRLIERGALSDDMRAECAWDANEEIRQLVAT
jgi:hypothetical protein